MNRFFLALFAVLLVFAPPAWSDTTSDLDALDWLQGEWVRQARRGEVVEAWTRVSPRTMEGMATISAAGKTQVTEYLRIENYGGELFYIAKPRENPYPIGFKLVESNDARLVFENPTHDFPQRILYERTEDGGLLVRIEGPMDGETRSIDFRFERK